MTDTPLYRIRLEHPPNSTGVRYVVLAFTTEVSVEHVEFFDEIYNIEEATFGFARWMLKRFGEVAVYVELIAPPISFRLPVKLVAESDLLAATWLVRQEIEDEDPVVAWKRMFANEV